MRVRNTHEGLTMLSRVGDGWFAEVEVNGFGLRLVCIETGAGIAVNVYSHKDHGGLTCPSGFAASMKARAWLQTEDREFSLPVAECCEMSWGRGRDANSPQSPENKNLGATS